MAFFFFADLAVNVGGRLFRVNVYALLRSEERFMLVPECKGSPRKEAVFAITAGGCMDVAMAFLTAQTEVPEEQGAQV